MTTTPEDYLAKAAEALAQLETATSEAERVRLRRAHGVYLKLSTHGAEAARARRDGAGGADQRPKSRPTPRPESCRSGRSARAAIRRPQASTTISQFSVLAMKQRSCASWWSRSSAAASGAAAGKGDLGPQRDPGDRHPPGRDPAHLALGAGRDSWRRRARRPARATRNQSMWQDGGRGDQRLLGIDPGRIGHRRGHHRRARRSRRRPRRRRSAISWRRL